MMQKMIAAVVGVFVAASGRSQAQDKTGALDALGAMSGEGVSSEQTGDAVKGGDYGPPGFDVESAMCYDTALPFDDLEFVCPNCGKSEYCAKFSFEGYVTENKSYWYRFLNDSPYAINLDYSGLCSTCNPGKEKVITVTVECVDCGKKFSWAAVSEENMTSMEWLNQPLLVKKDGAMRFDLEKTGLNGPDKSNLEVYLRDHLLCEKCRDKVTIDKP